MATTGLLEPSLRLGKGDAHCQNPSHKLFCQHGYCECHRPQWRRLPLYRNIHFALPFDTFRLRSRKAGTEPVPNPKLPKQPKTGFLD